MVQVRTGTLCLIAALTVGCASNGSGKTSIDTNPGSATDAGADASNDAGEHVLADAGGAGRDAGMTESDAGHTQSDAGSQAQDGGSHVVRDAGVESDAGHTPDAGHDAGSVAADAGHAVDAGHAMDASAPADAAADSDAGTVCALPDPGATLGDNRALNASVFVPVECTSPGAETPPRAVDGDDATKLLCFGETTTLNVTFPGLASYVVHTYEITSGNDTPERDPRHWRFEASVDGRSWVTLDERSNEAFASRGLTRRFDLVNCTPYSRYRLAVVENSGDPYFQMAELRMFGEPGAASGNVAVGGTVTSTCPNSNQAEDAPAAFDGKYASKWFCSMNTTPTISYEFAAGASHAVTSYSVTSGNDLPDRDPKAWVIEGSQDGVTWDTLGPAQVDQVFVARVQTRTYPLANNTAYTRYRLRVTANAGSTDFQLGEVALFAQ